MDMLGREINTHASKNTKDMHTSSNIADGARCFHGDMRTGSNIADGAKWVHVSAGAGAICYGDCYFKS